MDEYGRVLTLQEKMDFESECDDRRASGTSLIRPQCLNCVFYERAINGCPAFPKGIPASISLNHYDHRRVYPGQRGHLTWLPLKAAIKHPMEGTDDRER